MARCTHPTGDPPASCARNGDAVEEPSSIVDRRSQPRSKKLKSTRNRGSPLPAGDGRFTKAKNSRKAPKVSTFWPRLAHWQQRPSKHSQSHGTLAFMTTERPLWRTAGRKKVKSQKSKMDSLAAPLRSGEQVLLRRRRLVHEVRVCCVIGYQGQRALGIDRGLFGAEVSLAGSSHFG